jgi:hypothetical protein
MENSPVQNQMERMQLIREKLQDVREAGSSAHDEGLTREDLMNEMREHLGAFARAAGSFALLITGEHSSTFQRARKDIEEATQTSQEAGLADESRNPDAKAIAGHMSIADESAQTVLIMLAAMAEHAEGLQAWASPTDILAPLRALNSGIATTSVGMTYPAEVAQDEADRYKGGL